MRYTQVVLGSVRYPRNGDNKNSQGESDNKRDKKEHAGQERTQVGYEREQDGYRVEDTIDADRNAKTANKTHDI